MSYSRSQIDKNNFKWFSADNTRQSLVSISLVEGKIRGLTPFSINIEYPITAFSGSNGSGKSTMLALAACAFHNKPSGYTPPLRNKTYYTFSDFFIQSANESNIEGVKIDYRILHNNWSTLKPGPGVQSRKKSKGGKWNDYAGRVKRNVIYFGIQRVVPHYERSTHKSYRAKFKPGTMSPESRKEIYSVASRIIGKTYSDFDAYEHSKYTLPVASAGGISYSGFNMGAGEGSVFEILSALFQSGDGSLLIIDEIELGLHEAAQIRLIEELKKLCDKKKCQIICSTHSYSVLKSLPPEARFHIENISGKTFITPGASPEFSCGKMGRADAYELDIFVEDRIAINILQTTFPEDLRKRARIKPIGSHAAVIRQLASRMLEDNEKCVCILDGDQAPNKANAIKLAQSACEASTQEQKDKVHEWISSRIAYLPGIDWPERWIFDRLKDLVNSDEDDNDFLVKEWGLSNIEALRSYVELAIGAEKHKEFYEISQLSEVNIDKAKNDIISLVVRKNREAFNELIDTIRAKLP